MEDWQSEKCEVPLLEGVPVDMVLRRLDEACAWLHSATLPSLWADALGDRLMLRKVRHRTLPREYVHLSRPDTPTTLQLQSYR